jgi:hypothetical protein
LTRGAKLVFKIYDQFQTIKRGSNTIANLGGKDMDVAGASSSKSNNETVSRFGPLLWWTTTRTNHQITMFGTKVKHK